MGVGGSAETGSFLDEAAVSSGQIMAASPQCVFNVTNQEDVK